MRRTMAVCTIGLLALLATALVAWGQDGPDRAGGQRQQGFGERGRAGGFGRQGMRWGHGQHGFGREAGLLRLADNPRVRAALNLTDEQVGRFHKLAVESEKSSVKTHAELELRGIELRELLRAENPDHDSVMKKVDEISVLRGQTARQHMETLLAARSVLTPEQEKKLRSFREEHGFGGSGREHRMQRGEGYGRPSGGPDAPPAPPAPTGGPAVQ